MLLMAIPHCSVLSMEKLYIFWCNETESGKTHCGVDFKFTYKVVWLNKLWYEYINGERVTPVADKRVKRSHGNYVLKHRCRVRSR